MAHERADRGGRGVELRHLELLAHLPLTTFKSTNFGPEIPVENRQNPILIDLAREGADGGGGGVELCHFELLAHLPERERERVLYRQPTGPNPLDHRDD